MSLTEREVERRMIAAQKADRRSTSPAPERPMCWPERFVSDPDHRRVVKLWVWCEANGESFRAACGARGIPYSTAVRHRQAALRRITQLLRLDRENPFEGESNRIASCLPLDRLDSG